MDHFIKVSLIFVLFMTIFAALSKERSSPLFTRCHVLQIFFLPLYKLLYFVYVPLTDIYF